MTQITLRGGCLCGAVRYEITGEANRFYHCHCRRCRKATGTGHASNVVVTLGSARWTTGEEHLGQYKVPEAKRFATCFCRNCGSPLPRIAPDLSRAVIPAGSLDTDPGIRPMARIFWDSRAEWSCGGDDLPVYSEYVPEA
ncbi:MAG: GFA family protein [Gammaproteobacteria bacterium]|nr:GFA family protein [Gammaproteobacteria bacterium]